ncbi:hypothetical protein GCM10008967_39300 [Bacillus carboniphilus]|uniref:Uncharacterized protein n=1 Tax=Bacillus carboniphilus TaxID=86663 RepID=A0ABP3GGM4_9BACI
MLFWALLFLFLVTTIVIRKVFFPGHQFVTASGASIMAMGIVLNGALSYLGMIPEWILTSITLLISTIWILFFYEMILAVIQKQWKQRYLGQPLQLFAMGTWVAGTSMFLLSIFSYFPKQIWLLRIIDGMNFLLWILYIGLVLMSLKKVKISKLNGIILLVTVGTQSTVIINDLLYRNQVPSVLYEMGIIMGIFFYIVGLVVLCIRYFPLKKWDLADDWANPNCIIHGAASITGLAIAMTGVFSPQVLVIVWVWTFLLFLLIEGIEIIRGVVRVKRYGWMKGIGTYHVSQWARNFTFGMFFMFSSNVKLELSEYILIKNMYVVTMEILPWLVLLLFVAECALFVKSQFKNPFTKKRFMVESSEVSS